MLLMLISLCCLSGLIKRLLIDKQPLVMNGFAWGILAIVFVRLSSLFPLKNVGFQLDSISASTCMLLVGLYVINTPLLPEQVGKALIFPVCLVLAGVFAKILFGYSYFSQPYAIFVNLKNAVAVFLVASVPFILVSFPGFWDEESDKSTRFRHGALLFLLVTLIYWAAFCYRTRSSWWMILSYSAALAVIALRTRKAAARKLLVLTLAAAALGVLLLKLVPTVMVWRSATPYLDSLATLTSLENSSGRKEVWQVALHLIRSNPWLGVGTGGYPSNWVGYIPGSGVDPQVFALQVRVAPAFNDYLHMTAEIGILPGLLFSWLILGLPILYIYRLTKNAERPIAQDLIFCLCSLAIGLDSLFDFAFVRPESYTLHAVALNLAAKGCGCSTFSLKRLSKIGTVLVAGLLASLLIINCVLMGVGLTAKKLWTDQHELRALETALRYWPWDSPWGHQHLEAMLAAGRMDLAERYTQKFSRAWPYDAEAALVRAKLCEAKGDYRGALSEYRRALVKVPGGRCHPPGFDGYKAMVARPEVSRDPGLRLSPDELAVCAR